MWHDKDSCTLKRIYKRPSKDFLDAFFTKEFTALIKKCRDGPEITEKVISLFYFWVENMPSRSIRDSSLNNTLNNRYVSYAVVSRRFYSEPLEEVLEIIFFNFLLYFLMFTIYCNIQIWLVCFLLNVLR